MNMNNKAASERHIIFQLDIHTIGTKQNKSVHLSLGWNMTFKMHQKKHMFQ